MSLYERVTVKNEGTLLYHFHKGQKQAYESAARFTFIIAGTQSGKTSFAPLWLHNEIVNKGAGDYLAVTSTYDLFKLKFLPEMQRFFMDNFGWQYSAGEKVLWRKDETGSYRIILRSAQSEGGLESATAKAAVLDECGQPEFGLGAWEAIQRRLSLSGGRVFAGTTPYNLGWLKTQIFDRWRAGDPDYRVIQFRSTMNPAFPRAEYERAKRTLPAWRFEMFYNGNFSRPAGLIYEGFTDWHVCDPFDIPPTWKRFIGVDFGAVHTAKLWLALDPASGIYYAVDGRIEGNMTTNQHVLSLKRHPLYQPGTPAFGGAPGEKQQRWDWRNAGLEVREPPVADVESGINAVTELVNQKLLRVFSSVAGLVTELGLYSRTLDEHGQPTDIIENKSDFHLLDALRYVVLGATKRSTARIGATVSSYIG